MIFKSKELRIIAIETAVYQLFTWIIVLIWNTFVMRTLMLSMFHSDMNVSNMSMILWTAPIYIILTILLGFGPLKEFYMYYKEKIFIILLSPNGLASKNNKKTIPTT